MLRTSTLTFLSALILLAAGISIAALGPGASGQATTPRMSPAILATQPDPVHVEVDLSIAVPGDAADGLEISVHPASGIEVLDVIARPNDRLTLELDVRAARAGKWTVAFANGTDTCFGSLTIHETQASAWEHA